MTQVISIGLDGAAWHKLDSLIAEGRLPNLEAIVETGARGPLRTVHPPVTCPAWRCSTSGKNPGKLGVFWWLNLDARTGETYSPDARSFDTADVWDYLTAEGKQSAVVNVPMTYPPGDTDATMVSGFGAPFGGIETTDHPITVPPDLESTLKDEYDWQIGVDDITTSDGLEATFDLIRSRFELLLDLLEEDYQYLHTTIFYINMLQHKYGDGPETTRGWELIDEYLGELREAEALLILYSDHGHSTIENTFVVNRWLLDQGYLALDSKASDKLSDGIYSAISSLGLSPKQLARTARNVVPEPVFQRLVASGSPTSTKDLFDRVVWEETDAIALSQGPLYLNRDRLGDHYEQFKADLRDDLAAITHDGEPVLSAVHLADDIYNGPYAEDGPDLMLVGNDGWEIYGGLVPSTFEIQATSWTSGNHPIGMLALNGPDVVNTNLSERSILDVAPTILSYLDCPVPTDMDGEPILEAFEPQPQVKTRTPIESNTSHDSTTDEELEERLQDLGYLE